MKKILKEIFPFVNEAVPFGDDIMKNVTLSIGEIGMLGDALDVWREHIDDYDDKDDKAEQLAMLEALLRKLGLNRFEGLNDAT